MRHAGFSAEFQRLLEQAKPLTPAQRERQVESLAFGNAKIENDRISRPLVVDALRATAPKR